MEEDKKIKAILHAISNLTYAVDAEKNTTKQNTIITTMLILQEEYNITE